MPRGEHFRKKTDTIDTEVKTRVIPEDVLNTLADTVKALQLEVKSLKGKQETPILSKEKYVGPRQYRYKLYSEVINDAVVNTPILSYKGIKLDSSQDLVHSNEQGGYVSNHFVLLTLQGRAEPLKVPIATFMRSDRSELTYPKYLIDVDGERIKGDSKIAGREGIANDIIGYVFENDLGEFTVSPNCIN